MSPYTLSDRTLKCTGTMLVLLMTEFRSAKMGRCHLHDVQTEFHENRSVNVYIMDTCS